MKITRQNFASLVASIPAKSDGLDTETAERGLGSASELAEAITASLALEDFASPILAQTGLMTASISFGDDLKRRQDESPNFHWATLNPSASMIEAAPLTREYVAKMPGGGGRLASSGELDATPPKTLLQLRFEIGHFGGQNNMVGFTFILDAQTGKTTHVSVLGSNILTIPTGPSAPPKARSAGSV